MAVLAHGFGLSYLGELYFQNCTGSSTEHLLRPPHLQWKASLPTTKPFGVFFMKCAFTKNFCQTSWHFWSKFQAPLEPSSYSMYQTLSFTTKAKDPGVRLIIFFLFKNCELWSDVNIQFNVFSFGIFKGLSRCHIVLEDITKTKKCLPLSSDRTLSGLPLGHFKVFLATLAQFHAAGIAWWHNQQLLHQSATLGNK